MKYSRLVVSLLTTAYVVSGAAHPHPDAKDVRRLDETGRRRLFDIIRVEDNVDVLAEELGMCRMEYSTGILAMLENMMARNRTNCFDFLLQRIKYDNGLYRDIDLTHLLGVALHYSFMDFADLVLNRQFKIIHRIWVVSPLFDDITAPPWILAELKDLISRHPVHAEGMMPINTDMSHIETVEQALVLIELALHCDAVAASIGGKQRFDPTGLLYKGILNNTGFSDAQMAQVAQRLLELGAATTEKAQVLEYLRGHHPDYELTYGIIESFVTEEIKEPEFD